MPGSKNLRTNFAAAVLAVCVLFPALSLAQSTRNLTPLDIEIQRQQQRLSSGDEEERRDALMRLGAMRHESASRAALPGLSDGSPMIRAVAAKTILFLDPRESVPALAALLNDKQEFVRREAAYALGKTHSKAATAPLLERLLKDKEAGVRGAAAVALGEIADEAAVMALASTLERDSNPFVLRSTAAALGQIGNQAGTAPLIAALNNPKLPDDVRRESARSLGLIGDPAAAPALRAVSTAADPFLSRLAFEALKKMKPAP